MADYTDNGLMQPGQERYVIQAFRGIDDHERIADGSWQDAMNVENDFPANYIARSSMMPAVTRPQRKVAGYRRPAWQMVQIGMRINSETGTWVVFTLQPGETPPEAPFDVEILGHTYHIMNVVDTTYGGEDAKDLETHDLTNYTGIYNALQNGNVYAQYLVADRTPLLIGEPVDAVSVDGVMVTACEGGIITYGDRIMPTGAGIRHIAMLGRKIYCDNGMLIDPATDEVKKTWQRTEVDSSSYTIQNCDASGTVISIATTQPGTPSDGDYWYDSVRDGLYRWSDGQLEWIAIATRYLKLTLPNTADLSGFGAGDVVEATIERYKSAYVVHSVDNSNHVIVLRGMLWPTPTPTVGVTIERKMPVLDFICEHDNRIWGCRYGMNGEGADAEFVNEVYCCAQGDPMNWYLYEGTAADSWTTSVGAPGKWTGIKECGEYLVFFKEDRYYILSGDAPGSYRLTEFEADGVMDGCEKSIQNIGGSLFYKSVHGIRRLTPYGYPQDVSDSLNTDRWTDAIAGTDGRRYYVQMARGAERDLYMLDTETGFWTREDAPEYLKMMLRWKNEVLGICAAEGTQFAYVTYDREGAEAAMPKPSDYNTYADYLVAYFAWLAKTMQSRTWAGLTVLELMTTWSATSFDDLEDKADAKIASGHFLKKHNFWTVNYNLMRNAGRETPVPPGYTVEPDEDTLTELTGVWEDEPDAQWYGVTGLMGLGLPDEKRVRVIQLRIKTEAKTRMKVKVQTDETGKWTEVWSANTGRSGTHRIAYTPAGRNDTFRFRLEGTGPMTLYSITYQLEQGGDLNVPEHTKA